MGFLVRFWVLCFRKLIIFMDRGNRNRPNPTIIATSQTLYSAVRFLDSENNFRVSPRYFSCREITALVGGPGNIAVYRHIFGFTASAKVVTAKNDETAYRQKITAIWQYRPACVRLKPLPRTTLKIQRRPLLRLAPRRVHFARPWTQASKPTLRL